MRGLVQTTHIKAGELLLQRIAAAVTFGWMKFDRLTRLCTAILFQLGSRNDVRLGEQPSNLRSKQKITAKKWFQDLSFKFRFILGNFRGGDGVPKLPKVCQPFFLNSGSRCAIPNSSRRCAKAGWEFATVAIASALQHRYTDLIEPTVRKKKGGQQEIKETIGTLAAASSPDPRFRLRPQIAVRSLATSAERKETGTEKLRHIGYKTSLTNT